MQYSSAQVLALVGGLAPPPGFSIAFLLIVALPLLYGAFAAISGLILAWLYNVIAGIVGGIEIRTDGPTA